MRYDLEFLNQFSCEIGLKSSLVDRLSLNLDLGGGAILCFRNSEIEGDCLLGFSDTPWHTHGDLIFVDPRGHYVELESLDLLSGLVSGLVLVCEREVEGKIADRWLIHREYNDEFKYLEVGERVIARRALCDIKPPS